MHDDSSISPRFQSVRLCACGCGLPTLLSDKTRQPNRFVVGHAHGWKGGRILLQTGYVYRLAPDHPAASRDGYVLEHRLVMESVLGRLLTPDELVHHRDGDKTNNDPSNLALTTRETHPALHPQKTGWARDFAACVECGTTDRPYKAQGRCSRCYQMWRYRTDPQWRERAIANAGKQQRVSRSRAKTDRDPGTPPR